MPTDYAIEELLIACMARHFKGNAMGVGATVLSDLAARLAKALYVPDLFLVAGSRAVADCSVHPKSIADEWIQSKTALMNLDWIEMFQLIAKGKLQIWIGTVQIDRFGSSNISAIGPWTKPKVQLVGARGVPDDLWGCAQLSYFVRRQTARAFVERVDFVCGLGNGAKRDSFAKPPAKPGPVVSDLGVFDFASESGAMQIVSLHPGVTFDEVQERTGFELLKPSGAIPVTKPPTREELDCIRDVVDPNGLRRLESDSAPQAMAELWRDARDLVTGWWADRASTA